MKIVIFGLTISSSWGNGHATLWRGLCHALGERGHRTAFFERDVPYYASTRDCSEIFGGELVLYADWEEIRARAMREVREADVAIVTSYCPDALAATELVISSASLSVFYDLDTPVTLSRLERGEAVAYIGPRGLADFDLVLSYTGGRALAELRERLGAKRAVALYGHVDPAVHCRTGVLEHCKADLSYLGTFAGDRQAALEELFVRPAQARPDRRFLIGGAQYPADFPWCSNMFFLRHVTPKEHAGFYSSSRLTLNVTRQPMAAMGWCPSGRLFEAAACGTAMLSDAWEGLEHFFEPGHEILVAQDSAGALAALDLDDGELRNIAAAGRERALAEHTSAHRAGELLTLLECGRSKVAAPELAAMEA